MKKLLFVLLVTIPSCDQVYIGQNPPGYGPPQVQCGFGSSVPCPGLPPCPANAPATNIPGPPCILPNAPGGIK